jgi:hypothetical protein
MVDVFDPSIFDVSVFDVLTLTATTNTILRRILADMEQQNVGLYIWQVGLWEPGMWEQNTILRRNLVNLEK